VPSRDLPVSVRRFIDQHISSVEQLEVLLLLRGDRSVAWQPDEVANELYAQADSIAHRLDDLAARGLLLLTGNSYRYQPRSEDLAQSVEDLADAYARRRVRVITHIFSDHDDAVHSFSDAFRIRRDR
jgi:predicted transcriptional regulator